MQDGNRYLFRVQLFRILGIGFAVMALVIFILGSIVWGLIFTALAVVSGVLFAKNLLNVAPMVTQMIQEQTTEGLLEWSRQLQLARRNPKDYAGRADQALEFCYMVAHTHTNTRDQIALASAMSPYWRHLAKHGRIPENPPWPPVEPYIQALRQTPQALPAAPDYD